MVRPLLGGLLAGLIMFGLSKLLEFPAVELFVAGGAGLIACLLVVVPTSRYHIVLGKASRVLRHRRVEA